MKLLLVLVTVIAVFTADGRDFSLESDIHDTGNGDQLFSKGFVKGKSQLIINGSDSNNLDEIYNLADQEESDSAYADHQMKDGELYQEGTEEQPKGKLRRSRCKARNACVVMGGFCVTNATLCSGRLVAEGCKGTNCQCCVPATIEDKLDDLEDGLQSLKDNMNSELQSLKVDTNNMNSTLNFKLDSIIKGQDCPAPAGFFQLASKQPKQCFKFFSNSRTSWTDAKSKCESEGLVLAKPNYPVELRQHLVQTYGDKKSWVGARGTGSTINWDRDGTILSSSNSAWCPGEPSGYTSSWHCVVYASDNSYMNSKPSKPYYTNSCTSQFYPLCELLMG